MNLRYQLFSFKAGIFLFPLRSFIIVSLVNLLSHHNVSLGPLTCEVLLLLKHLLVLLIHDDVSHFFSLSLVILIFELEHIYFIVGEVEAVLNLVRLCSCFIFQLVELFLSFFNDLVNVYLFFMKCLLLLL